MLLNKETKLSSFCFLDIFIAVFLLYYYFTPYKLFTLLFTESLSQDSEWRKLSTTVLSILADFNYAVVLKVLNRSLISNSTSLFFKPLGTLHSTLTIIGITAIFMYLSIFRALVRPKYIFVFYSSFIFILWPAQTARSTKWCYLFSC